MQVTTTKNMLVMLLVMVLTCTANALGLSEKHDLLRDARLVFHIQPTAQSYTVTLSTIKKVNGQWRARKEKRVDALVERKTWELDAVFRGAEALQLLKAYLTQTNMSQLFVCEGLDCGSSNAWANEILQIKQLYGVDQTQYYTVIKGPNAMGQETIRVYYLVARGNGRVMLQEDVLVLSAGEVEEDNQQVKRLFDNVIANRRVEIPGVEIRNGLIVWSDQSAKQVRDLIQKMPRKQFYIVAYDNTAVSFRKNLAQSESYAAFLKEKLVDMGVAPQRLEVLGAGSLTLGRTSKEVRFELVLD